MIDITYDRLAAMGACDEGIEAFDKAFPNGLRLPRWPLWCQLLVLAHPRLREFWADAVHKQIIPAWSMAGMDLAGAGLRYAGLGAADLWGAYLGGANLRGACLEGANLGDADLGGACLRGAYLRGAYLRRADLRRASLGGANLRRACLRGANLGGANFEGALRPENDIPGWVADDFGKLQAASKESE